MRTLFILCGIAALLASAQPQLRADDKTPPQSVDAAVEGRAMPLFGAVDAFGQPRYFKQLKGKRALLVTFFPKCFTGNCTSQLKSLRDHYAELQKQGVEVWAISTDEAGGPQGQRAFSKHLKLPFPLLPDPSRKISLLFGAVQGREQMAARMSVFIDKKGVVRWIDKQIEPRTHGTDVLARVKLPPSKKQ